jgi:hypothetical protein
MQPVLPPAILEAVISGVPERAIRRRLLRANILTLAAFKPESIFDAKYGNAAVTR